MKEQPRKYITICEMAREATQAGGVFLLIVNGNQGSGVTSTFTDLSLIDSIPKILRDAANELEAWNNLGEESTTH